MDRRTPGTDEIAPQTTTWFDIWLVPGFNGATRVVQPVRSRDAQCPPAAARRRHGVRHLRRVRLHRRSRRRASGDTGPTRGGDLLRARRSNIVHGGRFGRVAPPRLVADRRRGRLRGLRRRKHHPDRNHDRQRPASICPAGSATSYVLATVIGELREMHHPIATARWCCAAASGRRSRHSRRHRR